MISRNVLLTGAVGLSLNSTLASASAAGTIIYGPAQPVPTFSGFMLIATALVLAFFSFRMLKKSGPNLLAVVATGALAIAAGTGGLQIISAADANGGNINFNNSSGGMETINTVSLNTYENTTNIALTVLDIQLPTPLPSACQAYAIEGPGPNGCVEGTLLQPAQTCTVDCRQLEE